MTETCKFWDGQEVHSIFWPEGSSYTVGRLGCKRITVVMENGEMAPIAWFHVEFDTDQKDQKFNSKFTEAVTLLT